MANTVDVPKIGLAVVVGPPTDRVVVNKIGLGIVVGPVTSISVSAITLGIVVGPPEDAPSYAQITQAPVLVISDAYQPSAITQAPVLVVNLPLQGDKVTQIPVLVPMTPLPPPTPLPTVPEVPVKEIWKWETSVFISEQAKEQRMSLRAKPRITLDLNVVTIDEEDRRVIYQMIYDYGVSKFAHPMYQYSTVITQATLAGVTKIYFDPTKTDMRAGETIAVFDPDEDGTETYATIATVDVDGATLTEAITIDAPTNFMVAPAPEFYFANTPTIKMQSIAGAAAFQLISGEGRVQLRPAQSATLTTLNGIPILTKRPLADTDVEEAFNRNVTVLDNATAPADLLTNWKTPFISGERQFKAQRPADMDYWRKFSDTIRGRRTAFLLPTWRNDLPLYSTPALSATVISTSNIFYAKYFVGAAARYVMIRSNAGTIYRKVSDIVTHYDLNGQPQYVDLILSGNIGAAAGSNVNMIVSLMHLTRLDSDQIELNHYELDTIVSFNVRTIDA